MRRKSSRSPHTSTTAVIAPLPPRVVRRGFWPAPSQLENRTLLATVAWASDVSGDWDNPSMWTGGAVPGPSDDAVISFSDITVTHDTSASATVDSLNCAAGLDITSGSLSIDTTSPSQPSSTVSGQFNLNGASLALLAGNLGLSGGGTISGTISGAAGTNLSLNGESLTTSSVISSAGLVALDGCTEAGSYTSTGDTNAINTSFRGPVQLGTSLEASQTVSFAPAAGGPVTLTTGAVTVGEYSTLAGTDSLVANGLLTLDYATTLSVPVVDAYGGMSVSEALVTLSGTTLNNYGAATWTIPGNGGHNSTLEAGAVINNLAGASFAVVGPGSSGFVAGDSSAVAFNNAGSFTCSQVGTGLNVQVPFLNTGSVLVQQGSVDLGGTGSTTSTGSFNVDAGAGLGISGQILTTSSVISSAGLVALNGCTEAGSYTSTGDTNAINTSFTGPVQLGTSLEVAQTVSFAPAAGGPVTLTTGAVTVGEYSTLAGTDSLVANGLLTLDYATTLSVPVVDAYGGMSVSEALVTLSGTTLNNYGAATWTIPGNGGHNSTLEAGAVINNLAGASFAVVGPGSSGFVAGDSSAVAFNNAGSFTCSQVGTGLNVQVPFLNTGSVLVQQGSVDLGGTGSTTSTGSFNVDAGAGLGISGQILTTSSVISSAGLVALNGCTEAGSYTSTGDTNAINTSFTGPVQLGTSLEVAQTVSFAPAAGGPVTLTTGAVTVGEYSTLAGTDSLVANGLLTLNYATTLSVPVVDAYSGMSVSEALVTLSGTTLNNYGAATWTIPGNGGHNSTLEAGAVINNLAGASFAVVGPGSSGFVAGDSSAVAFNNAGSFTCSQVGTGLNVQVPFLNTGSVLVQQGSLGLDDGTNSGTVTIASGANLGVSTYTQTAGSTVLNGGTINGGALSINGGALTGTGTINATVTNGGQVVLGGTGTAGTLTINGSYTQSATGKSQHPHRRHDGREPVQPARRLGRGGARRHRRCLPDQRLPARSRQYFPGLDLRLRRRRFHD